MAGRHPADGCRSSCARLRGQRPTPLPASANRRTAPRRYVLTARRGDADR
jgi:hypothetical protein